jgi:hypothetical protein
MFEHLHQEEERKGFLFGAFLAMPQTSLRPAEKNQNSNCPTHLKPIVDKSSLFDTVCRSGFKNYAEYKISRTPHAQQRAQTIAK